MIKTLFLLLLASTLALAQTPVELLQKSATLFKSSKAISLEFRSTVTYEVTGEEQNYQGDLLLGQNDRFRLRTPALHFYCDGANLWQYNLQHKQVLIKSLLDLEGGLHPSEILFRYLRCKPISAQKVSLAGKSVWQMKLDPTGQMKTYKSMEVWLDANDFSPVQLKTVDINNNVTLYQISKFLPKSTSSDNEFTFQAIKGVEEIDMR